MKRVTGYVVSVIGIGVMAVGFRVIPIDWEFFNIVSLDYIAGIGLAMVGVGVFLSLMDSKGGRGKGKNGEDEVPIYEGVGKSRRIVGYRKG